MSSNQHNPILITRDNYEAYFLMYIDEELTPAEKEAVEAFVVLHPDLGEELQLLSGTKLTPEVSTFDKSALFAQSMKENLFDESLLLYIDNELPAAQKEKLEQQLQKDKDLAQQHQVLLQTKLDATETVVYPYKEELYQRTGKRILPYWLRIAAAVAIVAGAGTWAWLGNNNADTDTNINPTVATIKKAEPANNDTNTITPAIAPVQKAVEAVPADITPAQNSVAQKEPAVTKPNIQPKVKKEAPAVAKDVIAPEAFAHTAPAAKDKPTAIIQQEEKNNVPQQIISNQSVTNTTAARTISTEATTTPAYASNVTEDAPNEKGGSLKGFLRKATRIIERRTGVKAANEDDEILIGVVALKLK